MVKYAVTEPIVTQACLIFIFESAVYIGFWVTNTFVLNAAPYHFDTYVNCLLIWSGIH
jgi:hypothetical protein